MSRDRIPGAEARRLTAARLAHAPWRRWGPYLSERQCGTVREDYSDSGDAWNHFTHDQARSRAYRWGEDGLAGISDDRQLLCFAVALWNGRDPILKERLFGLTNSEGNHGENVKEYSFYLDSTPTHSYMKYLYKYPQDEFPYYDLVSTNRRRGRQEFEYELLDTGVFDSDRYFDVLVEYAKASPEDILVEITISNRGPETASLHVLPTIWFRNLWSWRAAGPRPVLWLTGAGEAVEASHPDLGKRRIDAEGGPTWLFTENDTNLERLGGGPNPSPYVKDGINDYIVHGVRNAVNPAKRGTKASAHYLVTVGPGASAVLRLRISDDVRSDGASTLRGRQSFGVWFDYVMADRRHEANEYYETIIPPSLGADATNVMRQALAGMLWSKQGLDNIGVFDRRAPLPTARYLEQADGTAWMALFCQNMLDICAQLALEKPGCGDMSLKFVEHFLWIASSMAHAGDDVGMWDEEDGFFYDVLRRPGSEVSRLKVRSMVGLLPLCAVTVFEGDLLKKSPELLAPLRRFLAARPEMAAFIHDPCGRGEKDRRLAAILNEANLRRVLGRMLDEKEFLSPYGIRSLSRYHEQHPYVFHAGDREYRVSYVPAESDSEMFGGNSNWRGPIWMPVNALIVRALLQYYSYYGNSFTVECPTGSGRRMTLYEVARDISDRLASIFLKDNQGRRPVYGGTRKFQEDPHWRDLVLFYEYFHGDNGAGLGANHQTGWTGLVARMMSLFATTTADQVLQGGKAAYTAEPSEAREEPEMHVEVSY